MSANPAVIDTVGHPVLLDEWQRWPPLWDVVRRRVDGGAPPGSYLLAGSAAPASTPVHSGAGRIVSVRMRPMALAERGLTAPTVSVADLLTGARPALIGRTDLTLPDYVHEILASGFPGIRNLPDSPVRQADVRHLR